MSYSSSFKIQFKISGQIADPKTTLTKSGETIQEALDILFFTKRKKYGLVQPSYNKDSAYIDEFYDDVNDLVNLIKEFSDKNDMTFKMVRRGEESGDISLIKYENGEMEETNLYKMVNNFLK